ncbi:MAG: hypothetical protein B7Z37_03680 [Verrucomicrobia bacterium 12-59-8]|nr:MAG: hypothetical protein B7Z37_03680 [Verrucomicrobia bacterium 12-59-8]
MKTVLSIIALLVISVSLHAQSFITRVLDWGSGGKTGQHTSQAIINGHPAIAYFNETESSLMFARNSAPDGSGTWDINTVQYIGYVGQYPSLAQVNGHPAICYLDNTNRSYKYVRALDANGTRWDTPVTLDWAINVGHSSLIVVNGNPAVSFIGNNNDGNNDNGFLKFIRAVDAKGTTWGAPQVIDGTRGSGTFLSMALINGNPAVSYYSGGSLYFVRALDANATSWGVPLFLEGLAPYGNGQKTSLAVVNGNPAIAYLRWIPNNRWGLGYLRALDSNGTSWGPAVTLDDTSDHVGLHSSLAVINGHPAISYYDPTNLDLKYMRALDPNGAAWGSRVTLDYNGEVGSFTSLAEVNGSAAISYYDATHGDLKYIRAQDSSGWNWPVPDTVDAGVQSGSVGYATSQAIVNGLPAIAYYDTTNGALKYMRALDANGLNWDSPVTIDGAGDDGYLSLTTVNGKPAIAYFGKNAVLKYVRSLDMAGASWGTPVTADATLHAGYDNKLAVVNGNPAISYWDGTNADLKYVRAIDADGTSWGAPLTLDSMGYVGRANSLVVVNGTPAISYYDAGTNGNGLLKYIRSLDANGTSWATPLSLDSVINAGAATSLVVVNGKPAISYSGSTNRNLKYLRAQNATGTSWGTPLTVDNNQSVGIFPSLAVVNGNPAIGYTDFNTDPTGPNLKYVRAMDVNGTSWETPLTADYSSGYVGLAPSLIEFNGSPAVSYHDYANSNLKWAIYGAEPNAPDIAVSQSSPLTDGVSTVSCGTTVVGTSNVLTFTITNTGTAPLISLAVTKDGTNASDFIVSALSGTSIPVGEGTVTFNVSFSPSSGGAKTAAIHIASNVSGTKNPFDIALTGQSLSSTNDTDSDGMDDATEFRLAAEGFDWQVNQTAKVTAFKSNLPPSGYYTSAQVHALNLGTLLIQRNPVTNQFKLIFGLQKSTNLIDFTLFPMTTSQIQIDGEGRVELNFTSPNAAEFYRIQAQ